MLKKAGTKLQGVKTAQEKAQIKGKDRKGAERPLNFSTSSAEIHYSPTLDYAENEKTAILYVIQSMLAAASAPPPPLLRRHLCSAATCSPQRLDETLQGS